jgi:hypothetical protein
MRWGTCARWWRRRAPLDFPVSNISVRHCPNKSVTGAQDNQGLLDSCYMHQLEKLLGIHSVPRWHIANI